MPTRLPEDGGTDGDQCIIEGVEGGRYHVVARWEAESAYEDLCRFLLDLTGLKAQGQWAKYHRRPTPPQAPPDLP